MERSRGVTWRRGSSSYTQRKLNSSEVVVVQTGWQWGLTIEDKLITVCMIVDLFIGINSNFPALCCAKYHRK